MAEASPVARRDFSLERDLYLRSALLSILTGEVRDSGIYPADEPKDCPGG